MFTFLRSISALLLLSNTHSKISFFSEPKKILPPTGCNPNSWSLFSVAWDTHSVFIKSARELGHLDICTAYQNGQHTNQHNNQRNKTAS